MPINWTIAGASYLALTWNGFFYVETRSFESFRRKFSLLCEIFWDRDCFAASCRWEQAKDNQKRRRSLRLRAYDYSREGAYFVTLCPADRGRLFGEIVDGKMVE